MNDTTKPMLPNNDFEEMQNPDEVDLLPSLHGKTMTRFEGVLEHN